MTKIKAMELVNYSSSSSEDEISERTLNNKKGYLWLSDEEEDILNFERETKKQFDLIKSNETLQDIAHDLSDTIVGPQNCTIKVDTPNLNHLPCNKSLINKKLKRRANDSDKSKSFSRHKNIKIDKHLIFQKGPFQKLYFQAQISDKCVSSLQWYNDGMPCNKKWVLATSLDGSVSIWDCLLQKSIFTKHCHVGGCKRALWIGDNIFSVGYDKYGRVNDIENGKEIFQCENESLVTSCCLLNSDENIILTGTTNLINVWDTRLGGKKACKTFNIECGQVLDFDFLPNLNEIVCCGDKVTKDSCERNLSIWDYRSGALLSNEIYHERYSCVRLKVDPTRNQFVAQTNGSYVAIFSTKSPYKMNKYKRFEAHKVVGYPIDITFNKDYSILASGDAEGKVYLYNTTSTNVRSILHCNVNQPITSLAWNHNNKLVIGTWNGAIQNWG